MLDQYLLGEDGAEEASSETNKYNVAADSDSKSVDRAFDELMGA